MKVQIIYPSEKYLPSFHEALDIVAKERIYIEMIEAPPFEKVAQFQREHIAKNGPVYYAVDGEKVAGWCDIFPFANARQSHRGGLGMACIPSYRGQGLGVQTPRSHLKLQVYTSNTSAIELYKKFGFETEGLIRKYRKLDDEYFDCLAMAKFL